MTLIPKNKKVNGQEIPLERQFSILDKYKKDDLMKQADFCIEDLTSTIKDTLQKIEAQTEINMLYAEELKLIEDEI